MKYIYAIFLTTAHINAYQCEDYPQYPLGPTVEHEGHTYDVILMHHSNTCSCQN